jgi:hypothetical protein
LLFDGSDLLHALKAAKLFAEKARRARAFSSGQLTDARRPTVGRAGLCARRQLLKVSTGVARMAAFVNLE